jgi:hypothetical protein
MRHDRIGRISKALAAAALLLLPVLSIEGQTLVTGPTYTPATRVCTVHDFNPKNVDALSPTQIGAIALGDDGLYYTTSPTGGKSGTAINQGTIYQFSPDSANVFSPDYNQFKVLFSFDGGPHGTTPMGG